MAQHLRSLLQKNSQGLVHQPVSVGTVEVDRKVPPMTTTTTTTTMKKRNGNGGHREEYHDDNDKV
jgi:hypothetical protein